RSRRAVAGRHGGKGRRTRREPVPRPHLPARRPRASAGVPVNESAPFEESVALSPEWLTHVLGEAGRAVEVVERLETVATKVRFRVDYEDADSTRVDAFCVKAYFNPA